MDPREIIHFWLGPSPEDIAVVNAASKRWYAADSEFDAQVRNRFGATIRRACEGAFRDWEETSHGALALVILLDQFCRNAYRGTPEAFAGDTRALAVATSAVERGLDRKLGCAARAFLYHPFEHSEDPADQERSARLFESLVGEAPAPWRRFAADFVPYAHAHRDVIARFGRFPHRNEILGRNSTPEELAYLRAGGGFQ